MHNKLHNLLSEQGLYYFFIGASAFVLMFISIKDRSLQYSKLMEKNIKTLFFSLGDWEHSFKQTATQSLHCTEHQVQQSTILAHFTDSFCILQI